MEDNKNSNVKTEDSKPDFKSKNSHTVEDNKPIKVSEEVLQFDVNKIQSVGLKKIKSMKNNYDKSSLYNLPLDVSLRGFRNNDEIYKLIRYAKSLEFMLKEKEKDIAVMKSLAKQNSRNNLHFAFLFSSPLVRILNNEMQNI